MSDFVIYFWGKKDDFKNLRMFFFEIIEVYLYFFVFKVYDVD